MEEKALTLGEIARRLNCPLHKIEYLLRTREIQPIQRAGNLRVFSEKSLGLLKAELENRDKGRP